MLGEEFESEIDVEGKVIQELGKEVAVPVLFSFRLTTNERKTVVVVVVLLLLISKPCYITLSSSTRVAAHLLMPEPSLASQ